MTDLMHEPDFLASDLCRELRRCPLGFVDIGARGGVQPYTDPVAELAAVLAFEPDPAGVADLKASLGPRWKLADVEQTAVGGRSGQAPFHLYAHGVNHSLLPVNPAFRDRYRVTSLADRGVTAVSLQTLDEILFEHRADQPFWGELLKLDVQGAELDLLKAARRTLAERTVAVVSEVCFLDIYADQPRFSDLERFLAESGFTFYGFLTLQGWSQKFLDKRRMTGRERLCFGDAVFFKDPLAASDSRGPLTSRQYRLLYLCALLFGYHDFAIELAAAGDFPLEEAERLIRLAKHRAETPPEKAIAEVEALLARMKGQPQEALIQLGRFVTEHRATCDVADAALPRTEPLPRAARRAAETEENR